MLVELSLKQISQDSGILVLTDLITKNPNPRESWDWGGTQERAEGAPPSVAMGTCRILPQTKPGIKAIPTETPAGWPCFGGNIFPIILDRLFL